MSSAKFCSRSRLSAFHRWWTLEFSTVPNVAEKISSFLCCSTISLLSDNQLAVKVEVSAALCFCCLGVSPYPRLFAIQYPSIDGILNLHENNQFYSRSSICLPVQNAVPSMQPLIIAIDIKRITCCLPKRVLHFLQRNWNAFNLTYHYHVCVVL